ncbi:tyrosine-type recombinase/integrase [Desulfoscipio gibsoniae]|uniref:Site-specific recombinase XerD n=1 Tax=Desulfoscipio gibsoniae DSM 7213 TaxID=767817 RepID=R4KC29_9FIRM|nr:site-specific integrase [Desulfoscipio gibsoniae]AGL00119.1 site-specific recombinase XerD [Desulfoscipio gibsoniae DSM 7213]
MENKEQVLLRMKKDILLRGLSKNTLESYTLNARIFLEYCNRPVEQLNEYDIRNFLWYLINEKKASPGTVNTYSAAIRFLFAVTLNRTLNYLQIPRQKKRKTFPEVLTREEVFSIIESCKNIKHKAMLMVVYSSGLRVSEAAALKIQHIDSKNMRIFVEDGKGGKDRYTVLSATCLSVLREYWKRYRPKNPEGWLFLGTYNVSHITTRGIAFAFNEAVKRANITKNVSIHSLRHSFATHLLEDGATLLQIKELLGHTSIKSTTIYVHLANVTSDIKSPLDNSPAYRSLEVPSNA